MNKKLRIVLDTNILLVSISSRSLYHWIFQKLLNGEYELYVTTEILIEYEEMIASKYNETVAKEVLRALLKLPNVHRQLFVLPDDGLPYSLRIQKPFGKTTLWAIAVTSSLQFPVEMDDTWFQADTLRQQVRKLGLASSTSYAETEIIAETRGPSDTENDDELDLDLLLE